MSRIPPVIDFLTYFYSLNLNKIVFINTNSNLNINCFVVKTQSYSYLNIILHLKNSFYPLSMMCLEYFLYNFEKNYNAMLNFASLFTNLRLNVTYSIKEIDNIKTISSIFLNSNWLEREIIDFSGIFIIKLKDTRRLMLDYTQNRVYPHNIKSYDFTYNHFLNDLYTIIWLVHF